MTSETTRKHPVFFSPSLFNVKLILAGVVFILIFTNLQSDYSRQAKHFVPVTSPIEGRWKELHAKLGLPPVPTEIQFHVPLPSTKPGILPARAGRFGTLSCFR